MTVTATFRDGTVATRQGKEYLYATKIGGIVRFHKTARAARVRGGSFPPPTEWMVCTDAPAKFSGGIRVPA